MRHALTMVLAYLAWIAASAGSVLDLIVFRSAINQVYILFRLPESAFRFIDRASLFVFGAVCLFLIVLGEGYFRDGVERGDLRRRITVVLGTEAAIAVVFYVIPILVSLVMT